MAERRNFVRLKKRLRVAYRIIVERYANESLPPNMSYTDTISGNGVTIYSPKCIEKGTKLEIEISLDDKNDDVIEAVGEVIGCEKGGDKEYEIKIKFTDIDEPMRDRLVSYIIRQDVKFKAKKTKK